MRGKREMLTYIFLFTSPYHHIICSTERRKSRQINKVNDSKLSIIRLYAVVGNFPYSTNLVQFHIAILLVININIPQTQIEVRFL